MKRITGMLVLYVSIVFWKFSGRSDKFTGRTVGRLNRFKQVIQITGVNCKSPASPA